MYQNALKQKGRRAFRKMDEETIAARILYIVNFTFVQRLREEEGREEKGEKGNGQKGEGMMVKPDKK